MLHVTSKAMLLAALVGGLGCAGARRESYAVVPPSGADAALRDKAVVVEGVVTEAEFGIAPRTSASQYLFPWIPAGAPAAKPGWSATVAVQRVLKGDPGHAVIHLRELRSFDPEEVGLFPDRYGVHIRSRLRLGFDRRRGDRIRGLVIVPLGNAPAFDVAPAPATRTSRAAGSFAAGTVPSSAGSTWPR